MPEEKDLANKEEAGTGMSAMEKLRSARQSARQGELRDLENRRYEVEELLVIKEGQTSLWHDILTHFSPKRIAIVAGIFIGLPVVISTIVFIRNALIPGQLLSEHEEAVSVADYGRATQAMEKYLSIKTDDWERMAEHAYLLVKNGNFDIARNNYAKLLSKSPLRSDLDIQYLSAMSFLPRLNTTKSKMAEVLVSKESYVPALVAQSILENEQFDLATSDIDLAIKEFQELRKGGEVYQRYQDLISTFIVNLCRTENPFDSTLSPDFSVYPTNLRGSELFIYGLDTSLKIDICVVVPTEVDSPFSPDLGVLLYALKTLIAIQSKDNEAAIQSIAQSVATQSIPFNTYIDGLILSFTGEFQKAEAAFLRMGLEAAPVVLISRHIVKMLRGTEYWDDADELLKKALDEEPNNPQALNNLAINSMLNGRYGQAKNDLEAALSAKKFYIHSVYNLGIVQLVNGDPEGAIARWSTLSGKEEEFPGIKYYVGLAYSNLGVEEKALAVWRNSVSEPGYAGLSNLSLGDVFAKEELGYETALNYYQTAYAMDNENYEAALKLARVKALLGDPQEALAEITRVEEGLGSSKQRNQVYFRELAAAIKGEILFIADDPAATETLATAFENTKDLNLYKRVVDLYTRQLLKNDEVRKALDVTRIALPTDPTEITLLLARAKALAAYNDIIEALEIINDAERLHPDNPELLDAKAGVLAKDQRWDQAVDIYLEIFEKNPNVLSALEKAIALLERVEPDSERLPEIKKTFERSSFKPDDNLLASARQTYETLDEEGIKKAKAEIEEVANLMEIGTVTKFTGHLYRGYRFSQLGNVTEALNEFELATEFADEEPEKAYQGWQHLANAYILTAQYQLALESLSKSIELNPPNEEMTSIILTRAEVKARIGLVEEAIEDYNQVTKVLPNFTLPYMRRGILYITINDPEKAIEELSVVINIEPENLKAYRARYNAYSLLGDTANAARDAKNISLLEQKLAQ